MAVSKLKQSSKDTIIRRIRAADFLKLAREIKRTVELDDDERAALKFAESMIKSAAAGWSQAGRTRTKDAGRDAMYLREYRARTALQNAEASGASPAMLRELRAEHKEAQEAYEKWKKKHGLDPTIKLRTRG